MSKGRVTQHKPPREVARGRENAELKKENRILKKQLSRMRKQLLRTMELHNLDIEPERVPEESPTPKPTCPKCGSMEIGSVKLPSGTLTACKACGFRKVEHV